jgi:hypothetical protein
MGFFGELGKAFMGKPLGPNASAGEPSTSNSQPGAGVVDASGRKIIPDIDVRNLRSQQNGDKMYVKAWVFNNSQDQIIRVDTTYLLKQKRTQNQEIGPGSSRELTLYDGPAPRNENEHNAQIAYRLKANGDVFMENYRIEYNRESDGTYSVEELHDDGPVRDI